MIGLSERLYWREVGKWKVDLRSLLFGAYGRKVGTWIYLIWAPSTDAFNTVLYVGKTTQPVQVRLRQHISQSSAIGLRIKDLVPHDDEGWFVEVIAIDIRHPHGLSCAEKHYIQLYSPLYNQQLTTRIAL